LGKGKVMKIRKSTKYFINPIRKRGEKTTGATAAAKIKKG